VEKKTRKGAEMKLKLEMTTIHQRLVAVIITATIPADLANQESDFSLKKL
jgi:hypothetical protein